MGGILTVDLEDWRAGGARAETMLRDVDRSLMTAGFLQVIGHGVPSGLATAIREASRRFFAAPEKRKASVATTVGGVGWLRPGVEANAYSEGGASPPDMKESLVFAPTDRWGTRSTAASSGPEWAAVVDGLQALVDEYVAAAKALADELLELCAAALGQPRDALSGMTDDVSWSLNVNHYPPVAAVGRAAEGQFRIGPHTDFGVLTVLDRELGRGGLQVHTAAGGWEDAPWLDGALTVNVGDLVEHWTAGRWVAGRHRVLPPPVDVPDEDLVSLVYFYNLADSATLVPLAPPVGRREGLAPIVCGEYIRSKLDQITVG